MKEKMWLNVVDLPDNSYDYIMSKSITFNTEILKILADGDVALNFTCLAIALAHVFTTTFKEGAQEIGMNEMFDLIRKNIQADEELI